MNKFVIKPSSLEYKSAPYVDQDITISLESQNQQITEYDRSATINLAQVYEDERQASITFRPTFKINYLYNNAYTGTTGYLPFQYNLYYVSPETSLENNLWRGFPQYYEFDFYRPNISDQHVAYKSKSAYTYNWMYYLTYPFENDYNKNLSYTPYNFNWVANQGIPFQILNSTQNGNNVISFQCIAPHGLTVGEYVELSITYRNTNLFQVYSIGNGLLGSDTYIFNIFNIGYTGTSFNNNVLGTFKRVINPDNLTETKSKYYIRKHKVITNLEDLIITKSGFEKNVFNEDRKFEYSSITPNKVSRISQKNSSNAYTITSAYDLEFQTLRDNQKRPITEIFLTIINKGYSGYFNQPFNGVGLKQGWEFNLSKTTNSWWDGNNLNSNTNISVSSYTKTNGATKTFYYNNNLNIGHSIDGDFCEWNDYEQTERVISSYYQKLKFNQDVFQTTNTFSTNTPGYYYKPHNSMKIRDFSDDIETGDVNSVDMVPSYSFFSNSDQQFRWRDLYTYGFIDPNGNGVDYPYLNSAHYPFTEVIFRLIPEGINYNDTLDVSDKPLIDNCE